jgi:hypothetical protein
VASFDGERPALNLEHDWFRALLSYSEPLVGRAVLDLALDGAQLTNQIECRLAPREIRQKSFCVGSSNHRELAWAPSKSPGERLFANGPLLRALAAPPLPVHRLASTARRRSPNTRPGTESAERARRQVHVPERHRERAVPGQLLNHPRRRAAPGEVGAEGVPKHVRADDPKPGSPAAKPERRLDIDSP